MLANLVGWMAAHWRMVAILATICLIALLSILFTRSCGPKPKLNEAEIQQGERAVQERNDAALKEILVQSEVREKEIEANVANAEKEKINAIHESRKKWANANIDDLRQEFERRKNEQ